MLKSRTVFSVFSLTYSNGGCLHLDGLSQNSETCQNDVPKGIMSFGWLEA